MNSGKNESSVSQTGGKKQLKLCEICGALQSLQDNEKKLQIHNQGKVHTAYLKIRQYLDYLKKKKLERKIKEEEMKVREKQYDFEYNSSYNEHRHNQSKENKYEGDRYLNWKYRGTKYDRKNKCHF